MALTLQRTLVRYTVNLVPPEGPDDAPSLSVSRGDQIRWNNQDSIPHTLTFGTWIFQEPTGPNIVVAAGATTGWYTIAPGTTWTVYAYGISPAFPGSSGGAPDPPQVSADP